MKRVGGCVAWACIASVLVVGCYNAALIEPTDDQWKTIRPDDIEYVITKEGRKYVFETPPAIRNDTIVGEARIDRGFVVRQEVAIPVAEVGYLSVVELSPLLTVIGVITGAAVVGVLGLAIAIRFG